MGLFPLATAAVLLGLGWRVRLGEWQASLSLIVLFPAAMAAGHWTAYVQRHGYYVEHLGFWLAIGVGAAAFWVRVFTLAYRAERRAAVGSSPASSAGG